MPETNPFELFRRWFAEAEEHGLELPNAMALATASPVTSRPSNRFVLLKSFDEQGFVFYSNYDSRKGLELEANPWAAAVMHWERPPRQVRIEGMVERLSLAESDAYFHSRSRGSQISAVVSAQSRVIGSRLELESSAAELERRLEGQTIPRPTHWGGYRIIPDAIEFWSGRENRLHDRVLFTRSQGEEWKSQRLGP